MKKLGITLACLSLSVFSASSFASSKQLVCPYLNDSGEIWRTDTIVFDPDDFTKEFPTLTKSIELRDGTVKTLTARYTVSPNQLSYVRPSIIGDTTFYVDRTTLVLSYQSSHKLMTAKCEISDVEIPKDRAF